MMRRLLVIVAAGLGMLAAVAPAGAHEGGGRMEVLAADPGAAPAVIAYRVAVRFVSDDHLAGEATVTAVVVEAEGEARTPQPLAPTGEEGIHGGDVTFPGPGSWTVRFTSVSPAASLDVPVVVPGPPATATGQEGPAATADAMDVDDDPVEQGTPPVVLSSAVAVVAAIVLRTAMRRRRLGRVGSDGPGAAG